ncbi:hypothetical protein [Algivirga pacifica]|uniref:Uncharacterized protein n=1 Tax=Algivirga pacifica TaxID=1162670 RepID=A0ABP9DRV6_9BACT
MRKPIGVSCFKPLSDHVWAGKSKATGVYVIHHQKERYLLEFDSQLAWKEGKQLFLKEMKSKQAEELDVLMEVAQAYREHVIEVL